MDAADDRLREIWDRLVLLLIARPHGGWESEFEQITKKQVERHPERAPDTLKEALRQRIAERVEGGSS